MDKIKIVAAILDTSVLTLYKQDGTTVTIKQGDPRVQRIIDEVTGPLSTHGLAEVSLATTDPDKNDYKSFEEQASGGVKIFRVAKKWLKNVFFGTDEEIGDNGAYGRDYHVAPVSLGHVPSAEAPTAADVKDAVQPQKRDISEATKQIMANAKPVSAPDYNSHDTNESEDTFIATVKNPQTGKTSIIPGVENLKGHMALAAKLGSTIGVERFLERLATVIEDRGHTVDELLRFMSRGDLPIADDGSIVAYKVLQSKTDKTYVDIHSKQVIQRIGSYVTQANVDPSRRTQCSTGLHIARRGYLGGFHGDIIVLVKVAPEDVIAVPLNEPNKMRACGYHILSEIPKDEHKRLQSNNPIEGMEAKKLLTMALRGQHIGIIEDVVIGGPRGTSIVTTPRGDANNAGLRKQPAIRKDTPLAETVNHDVAPDKAPIVAPANTAQKVAETKSESRNERAQRLYTEKKFDELIALKKSSKVSWDKLNFSEHQVAIITGTKKEGPITKQVKEILEKKKPTKSGSKPKGKDNAKVGQPPKKEPVKKSEPKVVIMSEAQIQAEIDDMPTRKQKIDALLGMLNGHSDDQSKRNAYKVLITLKRKLKVGWMQLGVDNFEALQAKFEK